MKTMKKMISGLFALVLVAGFAMNVNAQTVSNAINASANLQAQLVWSDQGDIVFGNVPTGNVAIINPVDGARTNASIGTVGKAQLAGQPGSKFNVTFEPVVTLANGLKIL
jgi:hypothetical protein